MDNLTELKQFVKLHARAQKINKSLLDRILKCIKNISDPGPEGWAYEFTKIGDHFYKNKYYLKSMVLYNLAKFPYIDNADRLLASQKSIEAFEQYKQQKKLTCETGYYRYNHQSIPFYFYQSTHYNSPLLIVIGGIISTKEQWTNFLIIAQKLDITTVILEMPGVGENNLHHDNNSFKLFAPVIEKMAPLADITNIHIIAMSFGGNLALKYAVEDDRIKSIFTVGAPVHAFYRDKAFFSTLPFVTKITLSVLYQVHVEDLFSALKKNSISIEDLKKLKSTLYYISSLRDEIIPAAEKKILQDNIASLQWVEFDDVHGSPGHLRDIKLLLFSYLLGLTRKKRGLSLWVKILLWFKCLDIPMSQPIHSTTHGS